jgi:hypothetical protein
MLLRFTDLTMYCSMLGKRRSHTIQCSVVYDTIVEHYSSIVIGFVRNPEAAPTAEGNPHASAEVFIVVREYISCDGSDYRRDLDL